MEWTLHFFYAYSFKSNFPSESRGNFWSLFPLFSLFPFLSPVPSFPTKPCSPASFFWLGMLWFFFCGQGLFCKICSGTFRVLRMHRVLVFWACWRWVESNAPPPCEVVNMRALSFHKWAFTFWICGQFQLKLNLTTHLAQENWQTSANFGQGYLNKGVETSKI